MTQLLDDAARRLRTAWVVVLRAFAAGVFGLAIAVTIAVVVAGPETRDDWRALPARVASGEVRLPVVGELLSRAGVVSADAEAAGSAADRAESAASRGTGRLATPGGITAPQPFVASGVPYVPPTAAPAVPEAVPETVPAPEDEALPTETAEPVETVPAAPEPVETAVPAAPAAPSVLPTAPSGTAGMNDEAAEVLRLVNVERAAAGCVALRPDAQLTAAAQLHSEDMSANNYMSHTSQDGRSPSDRASAQGYSAFSGENVAKGYRSAADVMDGWMNSPGHRANILSCESVAIGVGVSGDAWTQVFGYA